MTFEKSSTAYPFALDSYIILPAALAPIIVVEVSSTMVLCMGVRNLVAGGSSESSISARELSSASKHLRTPF